MLKIFFSLLLLLPLFITAQFQLSDSLDIHEYHCYKVRYNSGQDSTKFCFDFDGSDLVATQDLLDFLGHYGVTFNTNDLLGFLSQFSEAVDPFSELPGYGFYYYNANYGEGNTEFISEADGILWGWLSRTLYDECGDCWSEECGQWCYDITGFHFKVVKEEGGTDWYYFIRKSDL